MDVDEDAEAEEDAEGEEADDIDIVGDGTHDDEGVVDDKDVVEEDVEDELIDVRPPSTLHECARIQRSIGRVGRGGTVIAGANFVTFAYTPQDQAEAPCCWCFKFR